MTVLFVDSAKELGGVQRSLLELAVAMKEGGSTVHAAVPAGALANAWKAAGISVRMIPAVRSFRFSLRPRDLRELVQFIFALPALARAIRAARPDIIHANGLVPALLAVKVRQRRPVLWHVHDLGMRYASVRRLTQRVACIVGVSEPVVECLAETVPSFRLRKVRLIRGGIDIRHFHPGDRAAVRRTFQLPVVGPLVGMIVHLVPWKRHEFFLDLAAAIHRTRRDVRFVIAGRNHLHDNPPLRARVETQIAAAGLSDSILWIRDLDDAAALLPAFDVLVHPVADEPFGRVLCEAMSAAIPVIAVNRSGPLCLVPDNEAGYLVPPNDVNSFSQKILHLVDNPDIARRLGTAARQHALANFDISRTAAEMRALYDEILSDLARERQRQESAKGRRRDGDDDDD